MTAPIVSNGFSSSRARASLLFLVVYFISPYTNAFSAVKAAENAFISTYYNAFRGGVKRN